MLLFSFFLNAAISTLHTVKQSCYLSSDQGGEGVRVRGRPDLLPLRVPVLHHAGETVCQCRRVLPQRIRHRRRQVCKNRSFSTIRVGPYVHTRQSGPFANLGRLELTYRAQTYYSFCSYAL